MFEKIHRRNEQSSETGSDEKDVICQEIVGKESKVFPRNFESDSSDEKSDSNVEKSADVGHEAAKRTLFEVGNVQVLDESTERKKNDIF